MILSLPVAQTRQVHGEPATEGNRPVTGQFTGSLCICGRICGLCSCAKFTTIRRASSLSSAPAVLATRRPPATWTQKNSACSMTVHGGGKRRGVIAHPHEMLACRITGLSGFLTLILSMAG
jgi:hypothetical protein